MEKTVVLLMLFCAIWAQNTQKDKYLEYTNKIINYEFVIKDLNKIKSPFYKERKPLKIDEKIVKQDRDVRKEIKITLLSIFDNKAYVRIEEYLGEQLIKVSKKWLYVNDKIYECKLIKLNATDAVFKCKNKILKKSLNKKIFGLRDRK